MSAPAGAGHAGRVAGLTPVQIVAVVGNPRPQSRTHALARTLAAELAHVLPDAATAEVDTA